MVFSSAEGNGRFLPSLRGSRVIKVGLNWTFQAVISGICLFQVISQLPEHSRNVFLYLCTFLQELLSHSHENGLDAKTIATLFGGVFIRDPPRSRSEALTKSRSNQQALDRKKASFVYHFLVNDQSEFILGHTL